MIHSAELTVVRGYRYVLAKPIMGLSTTVECDDDVRNLTLLTSNHNCKSYNDNGQSILEKLKEINGICSNQKRTKSPNYL